MCFVNQIFAQVIKVNRLMQVFGYQIYSPRSRTPLSKVNKEAN